LSFFRVKPASGSCIATSPAWPDGGRARERRMLASISVPGQVRELLEIRF
jgi:hypothetical protein